MYAYPVSLENDGDSVLVNFFDIPEAITFGVDKDEALLHVLETAREFTIPISSLTLYAHLHSLSDTS